MDPLSSMSKMLSPGATSPRHYTTAQTVRRVLAEYEDLKDIIAMLGLEELAETDRATVAQARRLERFLTQPFFTTERFTRLAGKSVTLEQTLDGCEAILSGDLSDLPESAFYMTGNLDDVRRQAEA
jgi:F-type H+-transporting ATPase subunit beta